MNEDKKNATKEIHQIVSGIEIPAESILENKRAIERGVQVKYLVQRLDEVNKDMLINWQKIGIEVKYFPLIEARIIIVDKKIVYITSYNPLNKNECTGVRFDYPPVAKIMNEVFLQRWEMGKEL